MTKSIKIWNKTNGHCWYCGIALKFYEDRNEADTFCIDHVCPQIKGGDSSIENLVPCCRSCNSKKGNKSVEEFRSRLEMPAFSPIQLGYLESRGITWDMIQPVNRHVFYFERIDSELRVLGGGR